MTQKIVISKAGFNVLTETDPRNLILDSALNNLKTATSGTISKTLSGGTNTSQAVTHGLGILPLVLGFFRQSGQSEWFITMSAAYLVMFSRPLIDLNVAITVDLTYVTFFFTNDNVASRTIELQYEILYEGS